MEFFENIWYQINAFFIEMSKETFGGIIFALLMGALVSFLFATKGAKKEKFIKNYFLFYLAILLVIIGAVLTVWLGNRF